MNPFPLGRLAQRARPISPMTRMIAVAELLQRPGWEPIARQRVRAAMVRADTFEKQAQLFAFALEHAPGAAADEPMTLPLGAASH
jgi:hypothetical protein